MEYKEFLQNKKAIDPDTGFTFDKAKLNDHLFDFQRDIVAWALKRGRACIFADCGLGKTIMQIEWAHRVNIHTEKPVLILAPLAVSTQTIAEGKKFGIDIRHLEEERECGIVITNYERLHKVTLSDYSGIVLDESSILKSYTGHIRTQVIDESRIIPFRLACTATPAPNDFMELGNHAEFVGSMLRTEMLSMFFVHDGGETQKWRLKGHARSEFWKWVCSWAVMIRKPSDLGYSDDNFHVPKLKTHSIIVSVDEYDCADGLLFRMPASSLQERQKERKLTVNDRAVESARLANNSNEQWLIWCNLNDEAAHIKAMIPDSVEVSGADSEASKVEKMMGFTSGKYRVLITKPKIAGFGMNWQNCYNMAFVGLSDSYEQYYQAVRRCWRFGQKNEVNAYIITASTEGAVVENIKRKERDAQNMAMEMVSNMHVYNEENIRGIKRDKGEYKVKTEIGKGWIANLGDCVEGVSNLPDESVGYTIYSPPFASLYTYSNSDRDMGNCKDADEFAIHFKYLAGELFRVTQTGRLMSFHCMNLPTSKCRDGVIGLRDFRGELIRIFEDAGFTFHSEVCIWKDPVTAMQRTKAIGLLHKQLCKDSALSRQGIPDYLVTMRKAGENKHPVKGELNWFAGDKSTFKSTGKLSIDIWQRYASPVWMDINPSNTLQHRSAKEHGDERHICPLQLDVIERGMQLWSNEGDTVLSPFMGIASEGFTAVRLGRKFIGFELKESYFNQATKNLAMAEKETMELL